MPKKKVSDITPPDKKTIRNIPIPENRRNGSSKITISDLKKTAEGAVQSTRKKLSDLKADIEESPIAEKINTVTGKIPSEWCEDGYFEKKGRLSGKAWLKLTGVFAILIIIFVSSSIIFASATISIVPQSKQFNLSESLKLSLSTASTTSSDSLTYELITIDKTKETTVLAKGEENVSIKARGIMTVHNDNNSTQPLVINTRFESPQGFIYRTTKAITVPANGTMNVEVVSDNAGAQYNLSSGDFKLPGLKGTGKYNTVYGRLSSPISGGFVGKRNAVSSEDKANAERALASLIETESLVEAKAQLPDNFILIPGGYSIVFDETKLTDTDNGSIISLSGKFTGAIIDNEQLSQHILSKMKERFGEYSSKIVNPDVLNMKFTSEDDSGNLTVSIEGSAMFEPVMDEKIIKSLFAGKTRGEIKKIASSQPIIIKEVTAVISPIWRFATPSDVQKIKLLIKSDSTVSPVNND